eukprot:GHVL01025223.1.p1 GENE.GHVL01025223.1~~GHVL01025223.1.p1  ORF type:complete len:326 (+),score=56.67 GHVL01025223.1:20-997(+)
MAKAAADFDTGHGGPIHDTQVDYYGRKLATASSDTCIRIWDISAEDGSTPFLSELKGHEGPVWQVAWAHPKYGNVLASCGYDKKIILWREMRNNDWHIIYQNDEHTASVNAVVWCPYEYGLSLACASSDGSISILTHQGDQWTRKSFDGHLHGVNSVSWAPASFALNAPKTASLASQRLVTGGCDNQVKVWKYDEHLLQWQCHQLQGSQSHTDWVRDVAWRPNGGSQSQYIASCSEDKTVIMWTQEAEDRPWFALQKIQLDAPIWRLSWSITGTLLSAACGDNSIILFKESLDGKWERLSAFTENGIVQEKTEPAGPAFFEQAVC